MPSSPSVGVGRSGSSLFNEREMVVTGGQLVLSYPELGLVVTIDRDDRTLSDPPIRWLSLTPPVDAKGPAPLRTPQGLFVGQTRQEALDLAARHFRAASNASSTAAVTFVAEGRPLAWMRPDYEMRLVFDPEQHQLREVHYEFKPGLTRPGRWTLAGVYVVAAALFAWALRWLWQHKLGAPSLPVAGAGTTRLVGRSLVACGGLIGVGALGALGFAGYVATTSGGNAYGGMGAFFLGMYAMTGLLLAAVLWFLGRYIGGSA